MIFIDSNVPMYLIGGDRRRRLDAQRVLERLTIERRRLATNSEVFQEILHRYVSADDRRERIEAAFEVLDGLVDVVLPVERSDVFAARDLIYAHERLSARDALHVAVMRRHEIGEIVSFDTGFDAVRGIVRLPAPSDTS